MAAPLDTLTSKYKGSIFSTVYPTLIIFCFLKNNNLGNGCEVVSHYGFDLHPSDN